MSTLIRMPLVCLCMYVKECVRVCACTCSLFQVEKVFVATLVHVQSQSDRSVTRSPWQPACTLYSLKKQHVIVKWSAH